MIGWYVLGSLFLQPSYSDAQILCAQLLASLGHYMGLDTCLPQLIIPCHSVSTHLSVCMHDLTSRTEVFQEMGTHIEEVSNKYQHYLAL